MPHNITIIIPYWSHIIWFPQFLLYAVLWKKAIGPLYYLYRSNLIRTVSWAKCFLPGGELKIFPREVARSSSLELTEEYEGYLEGTTFIWDILLVREIVISMKTLFWDSFWLAEKNLSKQTKCPKWRYLTLLEPWILTV